MPHVVAKPFRTVIRRFFVDQSVTEPEIDGAMSFEALLDGGFIADPERALSAEPRSEQQAAEPPPDSPGAI